MVIPLSRIKSDRQDAQALDPRTLFAAFAPSGDEESTPTRASRVGATPFNFLGFNLKSVERFFLS